MATHSSRIAWRIPMDCSPLPLLAPGLEKRVDAGRSDESWETVAVRRFRGAAATGGLLAGEWLLLSTVLWRRFSVCQ